MPRGQGTGLAGVILLVDLIPVFEVAPVPGFYGIMVGPMHRPTQIIPFVHTAIMNSVAHADRHAFGQFDVVSDQCLARYGNHRNFDPAIRLFTGGRRIVGHGHAFAETERYQALIVDAL